MSSLFEIFSAHVAKCAMVVGYGYYKTVNVLAPVG